MTGCKGGTSGTDEQQQVYIPKNAAVAVVVDLKQISEKADNWQDIFKGEFLETFEIDPEEQKIAKLGEKVAKSIAQHKLTIFAEMGSKDKAKNYFAVAFNVDEVKAFEEAIASNKEATVIKSENGKHVFVDEQSIISWQGNSVLFVGYEFDIPNIREVLTEQVARIRKVGKSESLQASDSEFKKLVSANHDVAVWTNQQQLNKQTMDEEVMKMLPVPQDWLKMGKYSSSYLNFEKGKIVMKGTSIVDPKYFAPFKPVFTTNNQVVKNLPVKNPVLMLSMTYDNKALMEILKKERVFEKMRDVIPNADMTFKMLDLDNFGNMFTGDMVIAAENKHEIVIGLGTKQSEVFTNLLSGFFGNLPKNEIKASQGGFMEKSVYEASQAREDREGEMDLPQVLVTDDAIYLTINSTFLKPEGGNPNRLTEMLKHIQDKKSSALNGKLASKANKSNFYMYMALNEIVKELPQDTFAIEALTSFLPMFDTVEMASNPPKDNKIDATFEITFKDKKTNALKQLLKMAKEMSTVNS
jgi:hypothetical protein